MTRSVAPTLCTLILAGAIAASAGAQVKDAGIAERGSDTGNWWQVLPRAQWSEYERIAVDSDWYEVYRIRPHVLAIYEPGQFEEVISFLIVGDSAALLFDTGLGFGDMQKLVASLTDLPVIVLNSHGHYDHIGGNHQFATIWGLDNAYARERAGGLGHDKVARYAAKGWISRPTPPGFDPASYRIIPYQFSSWIGDGQFIDLGGINLEVLATPGHSPDSICLIDRGNRLLFTGDTFYLAPLYAHIEQSDFEDYRTSAARLAALAHEVDFLVTSHNVPMANPSYLQALSRAFEAIASGEAHYTLSDGAREYPFADFSVLTRNPP